jgi:hypothetical protein
MKFRSACVLPDDIATMAAGEPQLHWPTASDLIEDLEKVGYKTKESSLGTAPMHRTYLIIAFLVLKKQIERRKEMRQP